MSAPLNRRKFLTQSLALAALSPALSFASTQSEPFPFPKKSNLPPTQLAMDENYWQQVSQLYDVKKDIINVENGNWGIMSKPVMTAYFAHTERVNRDNSFFSRREFWPEIKAITNNAAQHLGTKTSEIAFTRGATEALQNLIAGYNHLTADDSLLYTDLDYDSMQLAMSAKAKSTGAKEIRLTIPEPYNYDQLIAFYEQAFTTHKNCRLLLLTHISHRTGLALPVKEITSIAKNHGIDVIVDAAHSWGQMDFDVDDLGADFIGFNLHKWIGAPIGVGVMYIRHSRLESIATNMSASKNQETSILGRVHSGTSNFAAFLAVKEAFAFHDMIGAANKEARLRYLRSLWVNQVKSVPGVEVLTPEDERLHAGITSFRLHDLKTASQNKAISEYLLKNHRVFTVHRTGIDNGCCVRVTPSNYNSAADMQATAEAIIDAAKHYG